MLGGIFHFIRILIEHSVSNSGDRDQMPQNAASDLGLYCLPLSHKKDARLIWVNMGKLGVHVKWCVLFLKYSKG